MLSILSPFSFAPLNIASEEYILRNFTDDVFLLYINNPSIIVGKHQNTLAEINTDWVRKHNIPVVRRLTGGGSVFHDPGNLNFSFIMNSQSDDDRGFAKYTLPVLEVLHDLGIAAELKGRNDLTIADRKFSGNAKTQFAGKTLQHGTILFSSQIGDLSAALKNKPEKFNDKAVKSIRARVTNVSEHLRQPMFLHEFIALVRAKVQDLYPLVQNYEYTAADELAINLLAQNKYNTWEWNYGVSPRYNLHHKLRCQAGSIEFYLEVQKGSISSARIFGDFFSNRELSELEEALIGAKHQREVLAEIFTRLDYRSFFGEVELEELLQAMF